VWPELMPCMAAAPRACAPPTITYRALPERR
jgi:hypothetical protein